MADSRRNRRSYYDDERERPGRHDFEREPVHEEDRNRYGAPSGGRPRDAGNWPPDDWRERAHRPYAGVRGGYRETWQDIAPDSPPPPPTPATSLPSYRERWEDRYGGRDRDWWDRTTDEIGTWFGDEEAERRRWMDRGQYRGLGPRGYKRSDERIREDVNDRLTDDPYLDASDVVVEVEGCEVLLSGHVDSRYAKRRAEDIVDSVSGVAHCQNNLRVRRRSLPDEPDLGPGLPPSSGDLHARRHEE